MKIAALSEDGTTLSQHFGRAPYEEMLCQRKNIDGPISTSMATVQLVYYVQADGRKRNAAG